MKDEDIIEVAQRDTKLVLLKPDAPVEDAKVLGCKLWKAAIPQYNLGHQAILDKVNKDQDKVPGLFLGGNWKTGVAVGDCVDFGERESGVIAGYLKSQRSRTIRS